MGAWGCRLEGWQLCTLMECWGSETSLPLRVIPYFRDGELFLTGKRNSCIQLMLYDYTQ